MNAPIAGYTFRGFSIPDYMADALALWINEGIPPGSFLTAVLENNLSEAVGCADENNMRAIPAYVGYLYNEAPRGCWGSVENVGRWAAYHALRREKAEQE